MLVATYNIQRGRGLDLVRRLERAIEVLAGLDADVIGLQEVVEEPRGPRGDQPRILAEALRMHYAFHGARPVGRGHYGVALLSKLPVAGARPLDLSVPRREPRVALRAAVGESAVFVCHLGLSATERSQQVSKLRAALRTTRADRVVMGDFNEPGHGPVARTLEGELGCAPLVRTHPAPAPLFSLDRVYADAPLLELRAHRTALSRIASDHLPVFAKLGQRDAQRPPSSLFARSRFAYQR